MDSEKGLDFFGFVMVIGFLFLLFGMAIPFAFTGPVPTPVQYVIIDSYQNQYYVESYEVSSNGTLRLCGYWAPPEHIMWDTGYDWAPSMVELPEGSYKIQGYPIVKEKPEYCPEPTWR